MAPQDRLHRARNFVTSDAARHYKGMNKLNMSLVLVAAALVPATAIGGWKTSEEVSFTTLSNNQVRMTGSLIGAHNSADNVQYIGCQNMADFSYCWGRNASGKTMQCSTSNRGMMEAMASVNPASYLKITMQAGSCVGVEVNTSSRWMSLVKQPLLVQP